MKPARSLSLFCEMIPIPQLLSPPLFPHFFLKLREHLQRRCPELSLELVLRVVLSEPCEDFDAVCTLLEASPTLGLDTLRLWPQLPESDGVYLNARSMAPFFAKLNRLLDALTQRGLEPPPLLFDLEPPKALMEPLLDPASITARQLLALPRSLRHAYRHTREHDYATLLAGALAQCKRDFPSHHAAAVAPALWGPHLQPMVERGLGCPTTHRGRPLFDALDAMCYGSLVGLVLPETRNGMRNRAGAQLVRVTARRHRRWCQRVGATPGVILGCTSHGLFGHEPYYLKPEDLAAAAHALATPPPRLGVYNLRGLLAQPGAPLGSRDWRRWSSALLGQGFPA